MLEKIFQLLGIKKAPKEDFGSRCVLIVGDNRTDLLLVQRTVEKMGCQVLAAENGKVGFEVAKKEKPDLILSDCNMPELNGVEMCRQIKEDPETSGIPLIFLTNVDTPKTVVECFDMGVDNYICKPINPKLLAGQITTIFKEQLVSKN